MIAHPMSRKGAVDRTRLTGRLVFIPNSQSEIFDHVDRK